MAHFFYLFRHPEGMEERLTASERAALDGKWRSWLQDLARAGLLESGGELEMEGNTLEGRHPILGPGPYVETNGGLVDGYVSLVARDLEEATELARGCPILESGGCVEIRPVKQRGLAIQYWADEEAAELRTPRGEAL
jgi:hypothetical protein